MNMNSVTFSTGKPLGFYSQSLQDKLFPLIGNGEKLTLTDATTLTGLCGYAVSRYDLFPDTLLGYFYHYGYLINDMLAPNIDAPDFEYWQCEFHLSIDGFKEGWEFDGNDINLNLEEWIAFSRWSSELAELRLLDDKRASRNLTPGQLAAPWEVK